VPEAWPPSLWPSNIVCKAAFPRLWTYPTESQQTLLGNAGQSIANAVGVRFTREMGSVSQALNVVYSLAFVRIFDLTNGVTASFTPVGNLADLIRWTRLRRARDVGLAPRH
jgi:hypothetical protein